MGVVFVFTMRRATHAAVIPPGGAGLFVRCGSDRNDASCQGGVRLLRRAGVPFLLAQPRLSWA